MRDKWAHCLPDLARLATFWLPRRGKHEFFKQLLSASGCACGAGN
jgi:hypothetical protein